MSDSEGQVSETATMSPSRGDGQSPGTDDGIPPADASREEPGAGPRDYDADSGDASSGAGSVNDDPRDQRPD